MEASELEEMLETNGELMIAVAEFEAPIELHLHDTTIEEETVQLQLTDGVLTFDIEAISGAWQHTHSLEDFGLE